VAVCCYPEAVVIGIPLALLLLTELALEQWCDHLPNYFNAEAQGMGISR
jgi:hypothetical protein